MIVLIAAAVLAAQEPATTAAMSGGEIISKALARYSDAKTIKGSIVFTQKGETQAGAAQVTITTKVEAMQPNMFYLEQTRTPASTDQWEKNFFRGSSDGKRMGYTIPATPLPFTDPRGKHSKIYEKSPATLQGALDAFCTFLPDRSMPVALALYNSYEIRFLTDRLTDLKVESEDDAFAGKPCYKISASLKEFDDTSRNMKKIPATIWIDKEFNFVGVKWEDTIVVPYNGAQVEAKVVSLWNINLVVNAEIDKNNFAVK